jgi:hypothetical protein
MSSPYRPFRQRLSGWLLVLLVFAPALFTAKLVWTKAVDVGTWDMWENAALLQKWHDGSLTWGDLYAPQIQHRIVVPRLIILAMTHLSGGDFRWEMYANYLLIATVAVLVWRLVNRTLGGSPWRWPLMFAFNLLLFCPMHYQQLLWGSSMWSLIPMPCLLGGILLLTPRESRTTSWWRFAAVILLAQIATHSFAHGLATWPILLGLMLINPALGPMRHRVVITGVGAAIAAVTIGLYFTNFVNVAAHAYGLKPGEHALLAGSGLFEGDHLRMAVRFFFAFLGTWFSRTPFVDRPVDHAVVLGQITFAVFAAVAIFALRHRLWRSTLPWLALAAYVLVVGVMMSKRGADTDDHRAVTPRYLAISQQFLIATIAMTATLGAVFRRADDRWREKHPSEAESSSTVARTSGIVLLTAFCTAQIPVWQYGLHLVEVWHHARRQAQALLLFLPHVQDQGRLISMEPLDMELSNWHCIDQVNILMKLGLLRTRPLESPELKQFAEDKPLPASKAELTTAELREDGTLELNGHARFTVGQPVDAVLIVHNGRVISLGQPAPRHVLRIYGLDYEFSNTTEVQVTDMYLWHARVKLPAAGSNAPIELWALDVKQRRISQLGSTIVVDPVSKAAHIKRT